MSPPTVLRMVRILQMLVTDLIVDEEKGVNAEIVVDASNVLVHDLDTLQMEYYRSQIAVNE